MLLMEDSVLAGSVFWDRKEGGFLHGSLERVHLMAAGGGVFEKRKDNL